MELLFSKRATLLKLLCTRSQNSFFIHGELGVFRRKRADWQIQFVGSFLWHSGYKRGKQQPKAPLCMCRLCPMKESKHGESQERAPGSAVQNNLTRWDLSWVCAVPTSSPSEGLNCFPSLTSPSPEISSLPGFSRIHRRFLHQGLQGQSHSEF